MRISRALSYRPPPPRDPDPVEGALAGTIGGAVLYTAGTVYPSTWAHEMGHATATSLLYDAPFPDITVRPLSGGRTHIEWGMPLSSTGELLGEDLSWATTAAAAAVVDVGIAMTAFAVGHRLRPKHPVIGASLMGFAGWSMLSRVAYAVSALGGEGVKTLAAQGHDYAIMATHGGLHPLVAAGLMAAVLPAEYAVLRWLDHRAQSSSEQP